MAKLIYSAIASADGYIEDPGGSIDWGMPDEELLGFINELEQPARTYLGWPTRCGYSWFLLSSEVASERFPAASAQIWSY